MLQSPAHGFEIDKILTNFLHHCQLIFSLGHCLGCWEGPEYFHLFWEGKQPTNYFFFFFLKGVWSSNSCGHVISVCNFSPLKNKKSTKFEGNELFFNRNFIGRPIFEQLKSGPFNRKAMCLLREVSLSACSVVENTLL